MDAMNFYEKILERVSEFVNEYLTTECCLQSVRCFNRLIQEFYAYETDVIERLRTLKQLAAHLNLHAKKNASNLLRSRRIVVNAH